MTARKAVLAALAACGFLALALPALAQVTAVPTSATAVPISATTGVSTCTVNGQKVPCDQALKEVGAFAGTALVIFLVWIAIVLAATVFWLLMLVHAATHPIQNRAMWILIIVFLNLLGAIVYYFAVKRPFTKMAREALGTGPAAVSPITGMPSPLPAPVSPQLAEYVRNSRQQGIADDATRASLVAAGWNAADVDRALKS